MFASPFTGTRGLGRAFRNNTILQTFYFILMPHPGRGEYRSGAVAQSGNIRNRSSITNALNPTILRAGAFRIPFCDKAWLGFQGPNDAASTNRP